MSILIPGKMPTSCARCPCANDETPFCRAANKYIPMLGKPEWCPLIELPQHGRLIDADALEKHMSDTVMGDIRGYHYDGDTWDLAFSWLDHADTILPADPGGR